MAECGFHVYWWDGEYEGNCELDEGHDGPHFDGRVWYDDNMEDAGTLLRNFRRYLESGGSVELDDDDNFEERLLSTLETPIDPDAPWQGCCVVIKD